MTLSNILCSSRFFLLLVLILISSKAPCQTTMTQTSWSGGPGHLGPCNDWEDNWFFTSENTDYALSDGYLTLTHSNKLIDSTLSSCSYMVALDFDMDGDDDLFASTEADGVLKWYENTGMGSTWQEHFITESIGDVYRFALANFFQDDFPDLATVSTDDEELCLFQYESGVWSYSVIDNNLSEPIGLCIADINNDSKPDIVVTEMESDQWGGVSWFENTGIDPTAWTKHTISLDMVGPSTVYAADYDFDGDLDLSVVDLYGDKVYLCINHIQSESWDIVEVAEFTAPEAAPFCDIDGSGNLDIVIAELGNPAQGNLGGLFWAHETTSGDWLLENLDTDFHRAHWCSTADIDQDGDNDVYATQVQYSSSNTFCSWWENIDSGNEWTRHDMWLWSNDRQGRFIEDADFNSDGNVDFAVAPYTAQGTSATILTVDPHSFTSSASLTSSVLWTLKLSDWQTLEWNASCPSETSVCFQVRSGDGPGDLGEWSDTLYTQGSLNGYLENENCHFQYKVILQSDTPTQTPILEDVTLELQTTGISENEDPGSYFELNGFANPTTSPLVISLTMYQRANLEISCFDITGRSTYNTTLNELPSGSYDAELPPLPTGIYMIKLKAMNQVLVRRAIIIH